MLVLGLTGAMLFAAWRHTRPDAFLVERTEREVAAPPAALTRYAHNSNRPAQDSRCLAATASRVSAPPTIHRWKDADGVVHYSDKPPNSAGYREHTMHVSSDAAPIELDIISHGAVLPAHVTSRAIAHAVGVGKVMSDVLGLEPADGLAMQVIFAGTDAEFRAAAGPRAPSSTGVYISSKRKMVVRANREDGETLRTLRHEIVHAMMHEWVGSALPPALEEGLASYFAEFEAAGLGGTVDLQRRMPHLHKVSRTQVATGRSLRDLLMLSYSQFHGSHRSANYDMSTALIAALMASPESRAVLANVLRAQRRDSCRTVDAAAMLDQQWNGGLRALESAMWAPQRQGWKEGVQVF